MTFNYKDLYIAENIEALNVIAKNVNLKLDGNFDRYGFQNIDKISHYTVILSSKMKNLEIVFKGAQDNYIDQERAYIYLYRFLLFYAEYCRTINDRHFMEIRFESQVKKARRQLESLQKDLTRRYSDREVNEKEKRPLKKSISSAPVKKFPGNSYQFNIYKTIVT